MSHLGLQPDNHHGPKERLGANEAADIGKLHLFTSSVYPFQMRPVVAVKSTIRPKNVIEHVTILKVPNVPKS